MAYADQLARVGMVKINLARDFIAAKERGFIEASTDRYFIEAAEAGKSILAEYDQTHNADLLALAADLMRTESDAMHKLMQLPKAAGASANERGWHNFLESSEKMPTSDRNMVKTRRSAVPPGSRGADPVGAHHCPFR